MPYDSIFKGLAPEIRPGEFLLRAGLRFRQLYIVDARTHRRYVAVRRAVLLVLSIAGVFPLFANPLAHGLDKVIVDVAMPVIALGVYCFLAWEAHLLGRRGRAIARSDVAPDLLKMPSLVPPMPPWLKRLHPLVRYPAIATLLVAPALAIPYAIQMLVTYTVS